MEYIDLNKTQVYIRDEFDIGVKIEGIRQATRDMILGTLKIGSSSVGSNARMFLSSEDMYRMLFGEGRFRVKSENNFLIFVPSNQKKFGNAIMEVGNELRDQGYNPTITHTEYFLRENLLGEELIIANTRNFVRSYAECRPCIAKRGNREIYIKHHLNVIQIGGIANSPEYYISPKRANVIFFGDIDIVHIFNTIMFIDNIENRIRLHLLGHYFLQAVMIDYNKLLKTISNIHYQINRKSDIENAIKITLRRDGIKMDNYINILLQYISKINKIFKFIGMPKITNFIENFEDLIRKPKNFKFEIKMNFVRYFTGTHPQLINI